MFVNNAYSLHASRSVITYPVPRCAVNLPQDVVNVFILVDGTIKISPSTTITNEHFADIPGVTQPALPAR